MKKEIRIPWDEIVEILIEAINEKHPETVNGKVQWIKQYSYESDSYMDTPYEKPDFIAFIHE